ncbi:MAG: efflux transporter outer membrane subunit [Acidobacteriota bacterium]
MNKRRALATLVLSLLFTGCNLAPKYQRPKAPIPERLPQGAAYRPDTAAAAAATELRPEDFLKDPKLLQILELAREHSRDLRLAVLNVERARSLYRIQRAELLPSVGASVSGTKQHSSRDLSRPGEPWTTERYSVDLGIAAWEIDLFGRIRNLKDSALQQFFAFQEYRRGAELLLVSETARVYYTLAADQEALKIARSTLEAQQDTLQLVQTLLRNGLATELDLQRAKTQVEAAREDVSLYTQLVAQDVNALNLLVGTPVPAELLPAGLADVVPPETVRAGLSSEVLLNRPDVAAAEHQLQAVYADIGAARAALFPRIGLTALGGTASSALSGLFDAATGTWTFAAQAAMPIFDARTWAALKLTENEKEILLTQYERAIQTAFRETADVLAVLGTVDERIRAHEALLDAASEAYRLSEIRYRNGIDSYLSVLDAQRSLYGAQQAMVWLRLAKFSAQVRLYAVLGGQGFAP